MIGHKNKEANKQRLLLDVIIYFNIQSIGYITM